MTVSPPEIALAGLALAAAGLVGLIVLRLRTERPSAHASAWRSSQGPASSSSASFSVGADYEKLFTMSPHPMFVYDVTDHRFLAVNDTMVRRYGYGRDEFLQMTMADIRLPEDLPAMHEALRATRQRPSAVLSGTWRHRRKDGSLFHVRVSGHDLRYDGRDARLVQTVDVSTEVALQAEREQMIAKLQHSREWLATAINAGRIALWERDLIARKLVMGGRWAEILGTTAQAIGPVTESTLVEMLHPDDLPRVDARFRALIQDPAQTVYTDQFRVKHAHEGWVWVLGRGKVAERTSDGRARRVVGTYVDISDLKAAQSAREQQQAAEQANAMKSQFLSRVSHELRTPLNAVIGFSQLLRMDPDTPLSQQQTDRALRIERAGQHLLGLITDLMDLSRVELGALALHLGPQDLRALLDESLALIDTPMRERGITLVREDIPGLPPVRADALRLRQCLLNLLSNAVQYGREGGTLKVGARADDTGLIHIWVWNDGVGMTPEQLARLYEPFNRLGREAQHGPGTGIGLAISRQLVEHMGGEIVATSDAGEWAQFMVTLPVAQDTPQPGDEVDILLDLARVAR